MRLALTPHPDFPCPPVHEMAVDVTRTATGLVLRYNITGDLSLRAPHLFDGFDIVDMALSKARAEAVKKFLMTNAPTSFPTERVATRGYGQTMPIGTDAQNRRVEILLRK